LGHVLSVRTWKQNRSDVYLLENTDNEPSL
jgi:hypothetical protein